MFIDGGKRLEGLGQAISKAGSEAEAIIAECEQRWRALLAAPSARPEFWLPH